MWSFIGRWRQRGSIPFFLARSNVRETRTKAVCSEWWVLSGSFIFFFSLFFLPPSSFYPSFVSLPFSSPSLPCLSLVLKIDFPASSSLSSSPLILSFHFVFIPRCLAHGHYCRQTARHTSTGESKHQVRKQANRRASM